MPELPEVESVRATLEPHLVGKRILRAQIHRPDYVVAFDHGGQETPASPHALLQDATTSAILRRGKQLALLAADGRVACLHLGMSGVITATSTPSQSTSKRDHVHVTWTLADGSHILFADPRRFGGVWTFPDLKALHTYRWNFLGVDALEFTAEQLHAACLITRRAIKAVLLDQAVAAGIGNIYADESLFAASIDPRTPARALSPAHCTDLVEHLHRILHAAIHAGGSTLRDYRDATGARGSAQHAHAVYGRPHEPCLRCGQPLRTTQVAQRTTVWCPRCQPRLRPAKASPRTTPNPTSAQHAR